MTTRVLVVDDEPDILEALSEALPVLLGEVDVVAASTGEEALRHLEEGPGFDAIVSDERLPGMRGLEVLAWARRERPGAVRVLITAHYHPEIRRRAHEEAAVHVFAEKPLRLSAFVKELKGALDRRPGDPSPSRAHKGS